MVSPPGTPTAVVAPEDVEAVAAVGPDGFVFAAARGWPAAGRDLRPAVGLWRSRLSMNLLVVKLQCMKSPRQPAAMVKEMAGSGVRCKTEMALYCTARPPSSACRL